MFIVTLRSNIRFQVDGYETPVTLGKDIYIYVCVCVCVCVCFRFPDPT